MKKKEEILQILSKVTDPEIPVLTLEDLGIIRGINITENSIEVLITPTYTGCPATDVMSEDIHQILTESGFENIIIKQVISPAWTTDWLSEAGKKKLKRYGIAPPVGQSKSTILKDVNVPCPRCASIHTKTLSEFGSTACKALYQCQDCLEPFDYFKCHR